MYFFIPKSKLCLSAKEKKKKRVKIELCLANHPSGPVTALSWDTGAPMTHLQLHLIWKLAAGALGRCVIPPWVNNLAKCARHDDESRLAAVDWWIRTTEVTNDRAVLPWRQRGDEHSDWINSFGWSKYQQTGWAVDRNLFRFWVNLPLSSSREMELE